MTIKRNRKIEDEKERDDMTMNRQQKKEYGKKKDEMNRQRWFENLAKGIEENNLPWQKPWVGGGGAIPTNMKSKKAYRGGNVITLWVYGMGEGWTDLRFGTRKQLIDAGLSVKGLSNGTGIPIKYFKTGTYEKENKDGETEIRTSFLTRWYEVWCVEQCENYEAPVVEPHNVVAESVMMEQFYQYIDSQSSLDLKRKGNRAYYSSSDDDIVLPPHEAFTDSLGEVMTAMHEAVHSTGYKTRMNRALANKFGSPEYAFEELIAELGALIVTLSLGGEFKPGAVMEENANNVAYLQSWLKACREQDKALDKAFSDAQKAADYILDALRGDEE